MVKLFRLFAPTPSTANVWQPAQPAEPCKSCLLLKPTLEQVNSSLLLKPIL